MSLLRSDRPMTADEFFAFTETRPDEERWELIDGAPVLNASPGYNHQKLVRNVLVLLAEVETEQTAWEVLPGLGVKLSNTRVSVPDLLLRPRNRISGNFCDDMIVAFEILSPSTASRDLRWKRQAYGELPSLSDYILVSQDEIEIRHFARETDWVGHRIGPTERALTIPSLGLTLEVPSIYHGTGL